MKKQGRTAVIEDILEKEGFYMSPTVGRSMEPMMKAGRNTIYVTPRCGRLKKYDIPLYRRGNRYVLHRVLSVDGGYTLKGENCVLTEHCSGDSDVIGIATAFIRKGKIIEVSDKKYLFYVRHRAFFLKVWRLFWSIAHKFVKIFPLLYSRLEIYIFNKIL